MDKLDAMTAFARVVESGSFAAAARALGLTRSAVSKAVAELEHGLGVRLLDRTTRQVSPTEAGRTYFERCSAILADIEESELQVAALHSEPRGVLRVNAPMSFGTLYLGAAVADFMCANRLVKVELTLDDRFVDPLREGVDVTVRIGELADSSLVARRIAPARRLLVASPAYVAEMGDLQTPGDLAQHRCLVYGASLAGNRWRLRGPEGRVVAVAADPVLCSNNGEVLLAACRQGLGVAEAPSFICGPDLAAGRLVRVMRDWAPTDLAVYALYAPNWYLAKKTRLFIHFLAERFGPAPEWDRQAGLV